MIMNETIATILNRRSHRAFRPEQIAQNELSAILECGLNAPSAMNTQNWHFTVIQNKDLIQWMNEHIKPELSKASAERMKARGGDDFSVFYGAPTIVLVSNVRDDRHSLINCSMAAQNICLAAESLNIGSCVIGMVSLLFRQSKGEEYIKELNIPDGYWPEYAICLGYKSTAPNPPERIQNKVNFIL